MKDTKSEKKKEFFKKSGEIRLNPPRDWKIIIVTFFLICLAIAGFGLYYFFLLKSGGEDSSDKKNNSPTQSYMLPIDPVLKYYEGKKANLDKLQSGGSFDIDPSM